MKQDTSRTKALFEDTTWMLLYHKQNLLISFTKWPEECQVQAGGAKIIISGAYKPDEGKRKKHVVFAQVILP